MIIMIIISKYYTHALVISVKCTFMLAIKHFLLKESNSINGDVYGSVIRLTAAVQDYSSCSPPPVHFFPIKLSNLITSLINCSQCYFQYLGHPGIPMTCVDWLDLCDYTLTLSNNLSHFDTNECLLCSCLLLIDTAHQ